MCSGRVRGGGLLPACLPADGCLPANCNADSPSPLLQALLRNVYSLDEGKAEDALLLARYVRRELACLTMTPSEAVMAGNLRFSAEGLGAAEEAAAASGAAGGEAAAAAAGEAVVAGADASA